MAIFAVPNPKKSITIDFPINIVKKGILRIPKIENKYRLNNLNDAFNQITLDSFEVLSAGVYIDFGLVNLTENKTEINIEVRRKIGTFDQAFEVKRANDHIQKLINLLESVILLSDEEVKSKVIAAIPEISEFSMGKVGLLCFLFGVLGIHRFYTKNYFRGLIMLLTIGGVGILWAIDLILIGLNLYKDGRGKKLKQGW